MSQVSAKPLNRLNSAEEDFLSLGAAHPVKQQVRFRRASLMSEHDVATCRQGCAASIPPCCQGEQLDVLFCSEKPFKILHKPLKNYTTLKPQPVV